MKPITKYDDVLKYLYAQLPMYQRVGNKAFKKDLNNIKALCKWLDQPQKKFHSIHIAGTNGKGSVAHYISAMLSMHGLKVGLYTSPHYKDFRERIKINKQLISKSFIKRFTNHFIASKLPIKASFFELTVAMAFQAFAEYDVDIAIIETGLGGRLDSTNVINPLLSVITNIGFDHQAMLGNTLKKIATEKAGIIKPQTPVVIGQYQKEVHSVFVKKAKQKKAKLYRADKLITFQSHDKKQIEFSVGKQNVDLRFSNLTEYQRLNFRTALAAISLINLPIFNFKKLTKGIDQELSDWKYMGRMQTLGKNPLIIADSAHNEDGIHQFLNFLHKAKYNHLHIVLGMVNDKSHDKIFKLLPKEASYYFVKANIPRGLDAKLLSQKANTFDLHGHSYSSVRKGLAAAKTKATKNDIVCIIGSIFVVAEVL